MNTSLYQALGKQFTSGNIATQDIPENYVYMQQVKFKNLEVRQLLKATQNQSQIRAPLGLITIVLQSHNREAWPEDGGTETNVDFLIDRIHELTNEADSMNTEGSK